jgi:hypothetical protein
MSSTWTCWLLAGALAASLGWHLRSAAAVPDDGAGDCCAPETVLDDLSLTPEQLHELERWRKSTCEQSSCADGDADEALGRLQEALRDPAVPEERLRELAREVGDARAKSLECCVDSIVAVRRVLSREQLRLLLDRCCPNSKSTD